MSLSNKNPSGFMLSVEELDMPSTAERVLAVLRRILSKPYVQSIKMTTGRPMEVAWYKDISDSLSLGEPEESPDSVLSRVDLEEFASSRGAKEALFDAIFALNQRDLLATLLFAGSTEYVKDWLGIPSVTPIPRFEGTRYSNILGLRYLEIEALESDVIVLLASETSTATLTEVAKAYKLVT